jgi:hypothetical protein
LPLTDNVGRLIPENKFDAVEQQLVDRFGGLTTQQREFPLKGIWQGDHRLYQDQVVVLTVLDFHARGSSRFIAQLKQVLLVEFDQLAILITESTLRVH